MNLNLQFLDALLRHLSVLRNAITEAALPSERIRLGRILELHRRQLFEFLAVPVDLQQPDLG